MYQSLVNNSVFIINLIPSMIKISYNTILDTVNSTSGFIHVTCIHRCTDALCKLQCEHRILTNKHRKIHIKLSHNLCAWYSKTLRIGWLRKRNHLKINSIQIREFPACLKNFRICLYTVRVYKYNVITLLLQSVSMYTSFSSVD